MWVIKSDGVGLLEELAATRLKYDPWLRVGSGRVGSHWVALGRVGSGLRAVVSTVPHSAYCGNFGERDVRVLVTRLVLVMSEKVESFS